MKCSLGISTFLEEVFQFSSVAQSCPLFANPWTSARQASLSITNSQSPPNPCPLCWWCHPTISSSVVPFSSCPQSLPESGSFQMSQLFATRGQGVGVSASTSVPPMNTQDWSPLGWTGWISLQYKGLSRVFSSTTSVLLCSAFFNVQLSHPYMTTGKIIALTKWTFVGEVIERLLLNHEKMPGFLASGGEEFNLGPETRLDRSELLCNKVLLKYKGDRESFWRRHQKRAERVPAC